jgi:hypothetical protein
MIDAKYPTVNGTDADQGWNNTTNRSCDPEPLGSETIQGACGECFDSFDGWTVLSPTSSIAQPTSAEKNAKRFGGRSSSMTNEGVNTYSLPWESQNPSARTCYRANALDRRSARIFGQFVQTMRRERDLTPEQLASMSNMHPARVRDIESGAPAFMVTGEELLRIGRVFDRSLRQMQIEATRF